VYVDDRLKWRGGLWKGEKKEREAQRTSLDLSPQKNGTVSRKEMGLSLR